MKNRPGRPSGLLLNPDAARFILGTKSQAWWGKAAKVSTAHLSEMLSGDKAATPEVADRLAEALGCPVGALFPERVQFRTMVRHFVAPSVGDAA